MSVPERLLWSALRRQQTGLRFRRQHPAGVYVLDFYCDSVKLCVEVDGLSHDFSAAQDAARDRWLARRGVRTLRVSAQDVLRNLDGVLQYIVAEAQAPSATLCAPAPPRGE
jgi:very-short-patch-repair endonuclease